MKKEKTLYNNAIQNLKKLFFSLFLFPFLLQIDTIKAQSWKSVRERNKNKLQMVSFALGANIHRSIYEKQLSSLGELLHFDTFLLFPQWENRNTEQAESRLKFFEQNRNVYGQNASEVEK